MPAHDQTFSAYGAKLITTKAPYDPFAKVGDPTDSAIYLQQPGINFLRPWVAIRNGPAFQWPLGLEGYTLQIDPELGIHKFIGDNKVVVDVLHAGEEHFTMSGSFPGDSGPDLILALRQLVYQGSGEEGKILYVPEIMNHAQRVQVVSFTSTRDAQDRGRDSSYTIEFIRLGIIGDTIKTRGLPEVTQPVAQPRGVPSRSVQSDSKHNTLRKIALWKLGSAAKWNVLFTANQKFFNKKGIPASKAPDYRLPPGTKVSF